MNLSQVSPEQRLCLGKFLDIYGMSSLSILPSPLALKRLQLVNVILAQETLRPRGWDGEVGALLELSQVNSLAVVADLHGMIHNLMAILIYDNFLDRLIDGSGHLLILGDGIHSESPGDMASMENSVLLMDLVLTLKGRFPQQVHYLLGNHDSFDPKVMKAGVQQNLLWERALIRLRGRSYRNEMARFYELSPLIACGNDFIACHAGPPRTADLDRQMLIDARSYPEIARDLIWVRPRSWQFVNGYDNADLIQLRHALKLTTDAIIIVGHTPRNRHECAWRDPNGFLNHWVLNSAHPERVAWLRRQADTWDLLQVELKVATS